ncbi:MAG: hypothetical protein GY888_32585 [Planctomycetaceae bacterium]|nr:hypothetical protein [Planctomycetaceae bacterium]
MVNPDGISIYILTIALLAMLTGVVINHRQKNDKTVSLWLASSFLGLLLGAAGALSACYLLGYEVVEKLELPTIVRLSDEDPDQAGAENGGIDGPGPGEGGRGGGGRGSRGRQLSARLQLAMLVRKLELLTGDIAITLTVDQSRDMHALLKEIESAESLSDEQAQAGHDALLGLLDDSQQAKASAVSLPFRRGGGGRGSAGSEDGSESTPFREGSGADSIQALLERLAE